MAVSIAHNVAALLVRTARCWPQLPAVALGAQPLHDYATLAQRSARIAAAIAASGVAPGDRIALVSHNVAEYIETLFGCWWAGVVAVPVNAKLHPKELAYVLRDSGARWVFVDQDWATSIGMALQEAHRAERVIEFGGREYATLLGADPSPVPHPRAPDDPAWLFYTSGTTGRPKGVMITHANLQAMAQCFLSDVEAIAPGDALLHPAPLSHGSGLYVLPHVLAGAVSVVPESGGFDPAEIVALLGAWRGSCLFAAPTMVKRLVDSPALAGASLSGLKSIVYGGGPMYVADCRQAFAALGPRLAQIYGQGETPMTITAMRREMLADAMHRGDEGRIGSVGVAQTGIEVRIAGAEEARAGGGAVGEVLVRGPTVMRGYWNNPGATAAALADGWLHTGDVGVLDADGFLTLKDRSKDLIISGGSNIYPREVEEVLLRHPDVAEVAVVGRRHAEWGEEVVACVVVRGGAIASPSSQAALERALDAWCLEHIARFKRPKAYRFVGELPKNNTGKVLKTALREGLDAADAEPG